MSLCERSFALLYGAYSDSAGCSQGAASDAGCRCGFWNFRLDRFGYWYGAGSWFSARRLLGGCVFFHITWPVDFETKGNGLRRSDEWNRLNLMKPSALVPGSRMPSYRHLFEGEGLRGEALLAYLNSLQPSSSGTNE